MRKGATVPRGRTSATFVRLRPRDLRRPDPRRGSRPICTTARPRSEAITTPRTTSPTANGQSHSSRWSGSGKQAVLQERRSSGFTKPRARGRARAAPAQRLGGRALQRRVEGGVDAQAALVDALAAVLALEVLAHLLEEVGRDRAAGPCAGAAPAARPWRPRPRRRRCTSPRPCGRARGCAGAARARAVDGREPGRVLGQPGEEGRLGEA